MKHGWAVNAVLLVAVVALGAFVYFKPRSDTPVSHPLSTLQANQVKHIRIERKGDPPVVIERNGDTWFITAPVPAQADAFQVQRLLAILDATSAHRLAATDFTRFDLDRPLVRLTIDGEQFSFGAVNAVTREQYVLAGGAVYAIAPRYGAMMPVNIAHLIRKQLFASNESPVRFEFRDFTVAQSAGRWRVSPPISELSQDDVNRWVDSWRHAAALRAEPHSGGMPLDAVKMELKDGRTLTLDILQKGSEFVIARPDEKLRYHFAAETAKQLLAPPGNIQPKQP
jgi:hypothetical protein